MLFLARDEDCPVSGRLGILSGRITDKRRLEFRCTAVDTSITCGSFFADTTSFTLRANARTITLTRYSWYQIRLQDTNIWDIARNGNKPLPGIP
jgi:hypothetical protein